MTVYILHAPSAGKFKVGYTDNLGRRLAEIQAMSPVELTLIDTVDGAGYGAENAFHNILRDHLSHGEWFHDAGLEKALGYAGVVRAAAADAAGVIRSHVPTDLLPRVIALAETAGAPNIAHELTGQSIMDQRYSE